MHTPFLIFVSIVTLSSFSARASTPLSSYSFQDRPVIKKLIMTPTYIDLFENQNIEVIQSAPTSKVSLTGISLSSGTPYAHLSYGESHSFAKIGETLPDGSKLISIDVNRGNITTLKNNLFTTHTLLKYD